jgi:fused signal recognition particle receptor
MLGAGDTFRAAAVEQLQAWGARNDVPVIAQAAGADPAAVAHDAMHAAQARGMDILILDTAGRLQTQSGLMDELKKVRRVLTRIDPDAPHEVLLVLDAGIGQNALNQVQEFNAAVQVTGLAVTKLDGTAKGGVLVAIAKRTGLPIRYIGVGEDIADLRPFEAEAFATAIVPESIT